MKRRILVVDDHADLRKLLRMTLQSKDCEVFEAADGEQALDMVESLRPDTVILDVMMPGDLDGYTVCRTIKKQSRNRNVMVILLTAKGQARDIDQGRRAMADAYLVKPFSPLELLEVVEKRDRLHIVRD